MQLAESTLISVPHSPCGKIFGLQFQGIILSKLFTIHILKHFKKQKKQTKKDDKKCSAQTALH